MVVQKAVSAEQRSSRLPAPLARYRPEYPFPSCVPAELESVFPGTDERTTFQRLLPNHWTQEFMPEKSISKLKVTSNLDVFAQKCRHLLMQTRF